MVKIYQAERDAGLTDKIKASTSLAFSSQAVKMSDGVSPKVKAGANPYQFDLYYLQSVLASVGWNKNDDVFDKAEIWNARYTPTDKQFNFLHDETDIIGHITSAKVLDFNGNTIPENISAAELPDQFEVVVGSVIYKKWEDPELQARIDKLIAEIEQGKWFVSMECLFGDFDYAVITPDNEHKVIVRDESSAFLTQHLRAYGGEGTWEGNKIGRLLRGFVFSGKGLVDDPAGHRSLILNHSNESEEFQGTQASIKEVEIMSDTVSKQDYEMVVAELKELKAAQSSAVSQEIETLKSDNQKLQEAKAAVEQKLEAQQEIVAAKDAQISELNDQLQAKADELDETKQVLSEIQTKAVNERRLRELGEREVAEDKAADLVEKFADLPDESFTALIAAFPYKKKDKDKDKKEDDNMDDSKASDAEVAEAVDDVLDNVEGSDASVNFVDTGDEKIELRSNASAWINSMLSMTSKGDK